MIVYAGEKDLVLQWLYSTGFESDDVAFESEKIVANLTKAQVFEAQTLENVLRIETYRHVVTVPLT